MKIMSVRRASNIISVRSKLAWLACDWNRKELRLYHDDGRLLSAGMKTIHARQRSDKSLLKVEIIGAKELTSTKVWNQCNPQCILAMGKTEASTSEIWSESAPLWGEEFYFQINPSATLEIQVLSKQTFFTEYLGRVRIPVSSIFSGLERAAMLGMKNWEVYFVLLSNEWSSEPYKPGSHLPWFEDGAPSMDRSMEQEAEGSSAEDSPFGMYGYRHMPLPRIRGRLFVTFSLVERGEPGRIEQFECARKDVAEDAGKAKGKTNKSGTIRVIPQPKTNTESACMIKANMRAKEEKWQESQGVFRILALDGGGVRGVFSAALLARLCAIHPQLLDEVDVICGTSTGGLIALLLGLGYTAEEVTCIYQYHLPTIFSTNPARRYSPFCSSYRKENLSKVIEIYCEDKCFRDLQRHLVITSFMVDSSKSSPPPQLNNHLDPAIEHAWGSSDGSWHPAVFSNIPQTVKGTRAPDLDLPVLQAGLRTTAAPTLFPLHDGYTDGAVYANNPSLVGLAKIKAHFPRIKSRDFRILSVGTGRFPYRAEVPGDGNADWGIRQWAPHLLDMLNDASSVNVDMNMRLILGQNYHRLDPRLPWRISIDNLDAIEELVLLARQADLTGVSDFIRDRWLNPSPPPIV